MPSSMIAAPLTMWSLIPRILIRDKPPAQMFRPSSTRREGSRFRGYGLAARAADLLLEDPVRLPIQNEEAPKQERQRSGGCHRDVVEWVCGKDVRIEAEDPDPG